MNGIAYMDVWTDCVCGERMLVHVDRDGIMTTKHTCEESI